MTVLSITQHPGHFNPSGTTVSDNVRSMATGQDFSGLLVDAASVLALHAQIVRQDKQDIDLVLFEPAVPGEGPSTMTFETEQAFLTEFAEAGVPVVILFKGLHNHPSEQRAQRMKNAVQRSIAINIADLENPELQATIVKWISVRRANLNNRPAGEQGLGPDAPTTRSSAAPNFNAGFHPALL